jgi:hypothetical protein
MLNKITFTQQLLDQLKWEFKPTLDDALKDWWKNPDEHAGLRLTAEGFFVFGLLEISHYEFDVPPSMPALPGQLLTLDRKLTCPYYIFLGKKPKLLLFGSKEATMYSLYGDLEKFLRGISRQ